MAFGLKDPQKAHQHTSSEISLQDEAELKRLTGCLAPGGQVIVDACSGGAGRQAEENIANMMRRVFPQAAPQGIFSAAEMTALYRLEFNDNKIQRVRFSGEEYQAFVTNGNPSTVKA